MSSKSGLTDAESSKLKSFKDEEDGTLKTVQSTTDVAYVPVLAVVRGVTSAVTNMATYVPSADAVHTLDGALQLLGAACAGCPFLLPVQMALSQLGGMMKVRTLPSTGQDVGDSYDTIFLVHRT